MVDGHQKKATVFESYQLTVLYLSFLSVPWCCIESLIHTAKCVYAVSYYCILAKTDNKNPYFPSFFFSFLLQLFFFLSSFFSFLLKILWRKELWHASLAANQRTRIHQ
jgi:hypothetical protein